MLDAQKRANTLEQALHKQAQGHQFQLEQTRTQLTQQIDSERTTHKSASDEVASLNKKYEDERKASRKLAEMAVELKAHADTVDKQLEAKNDECMYFQAQL